MKKHTTRTIRLLSLLLATILFLACFSACDQPGGEAEKTDEELIEERINLFLDAYNDGDMDAVLTCLDNKTRNAFQAYMNILGGIAGSYAGFDIDLSDLFSLGIATTSGDFMGLQINNIVIENDTKATATTTMNLTGSGTQTIYFVMVYEKGGWYINDMTDKKVSVETNSSNQGEIDENEITIKYVKDYTYNDSYGFETRYYYDGTAPIIFNMNDTIYTGIINSKGKIIYYREADNLLDYVEWCSTGNGAGVVIEKDDNYKKSYVFFNKEGYKTLLLKEGEFFDKIIGCGDGLFWVYKDTSTITKEEHCYGVLDYNGNWIKSLTPGEYIKTSTFSLELYNNYKYMGEGIFKWRWDNYLYNMNTNQYFEFEYGTIYSDKATNGVIYCKYSDWSESKYYGYKTDGTIEEVPKFSYAYDNLLINKEGEYMTVWDMNNNMQYDYTLFPTNMIESVEFDDEFGVIALRGVDKKYYFTVIDKECNQKVTPIVCTKCRVCISNNRITYKNENGYYEVIDVNGNKIVAESEKYSYISKFSGESAIARKDGLYYLIGLDGRPVSIKLK